MKKPRTEITNERAKFLLSAYRHNGADAQDPIFRDALEQATRDPDLASWFANQRSFDALLCEKLNSVQPPASLKPAILSGIYSVGSKPRFTLGRLLGVAAVLFLSGILLTVMQLRSVPDGHSLSEFENTAVAVLSEGPKLDFLTSDFSRSQEYLLQQAVPHASEIPAALHGLPTVGCRAIDWNGKMISLTCFCLPSGQLLHLFVVDAKSLGKIAPQGDIQEINGWHVKFRREKGLLLMFISKAPMPELIRYI
jgi:hypothetical protein